MAAAAPRDNLEAEIEAALGKLYYFIESDLKNNCIEKALALLEEDDWVTEKEEGEVVIRSRLGEHGRKMWLCVAELSIAPHTLQDRLLDIDNLAKVHTQDKHRTVKIINFHIYEYTIFGEARSRLQAPPF